MEKIRIGKDITFVWQVRKDGEALTAEDTANLTLEIAGRNGKFQRLPFEVRDNKIIAVWYGVKQTEVGAYRLACWYNRGKVSESVVDVVWAVELVQYTTEESFDDLETVTIELEAGNLTFGVLKGASSAKELSYDNSKSGLDATNAQDAIDEEAQNISDLQNQLPTAVSRTTDAVRFTNKEGQVLNNMLIREATDNVAGVLTAVGHKNLNRLLCNFHYLGEFSTSGEGEQIALAYAHDPKYILMYYIVKRGTNSAVGVIEQYVVDANNRDTDQYLHWNGNLYYRRVQGSTASAWVQLATPTQAQWNEVSTKANDAKDGVTNINSLIPSQASAQNQLADKNFVNSSIGTNTANYISNNGQPFASVAELEAYSGTLTNNDYAFVVGTDGAGNTTYTRYKYNANTQTWAAEYVLNNSSFTAAQWATIQSGMTSEDVLKLRDLPFASGLPVAGRLTTAGFQFFNLYGSVLFTIPFADSTGGGLITLEDLTRFIDLGTKQELDAKFARKQDKIPLINGEGTNSMCTDSTNTASGELSLAIGKDNSATRLGAVAIGNGNETKQEWAFCLGEYNSTIGWDSCAIGTRNTILRHMAMAFGRYNTVRAWASIAIGLGLVTYDNQDNEDNNGEVALGRYNVSATGQIFSVGCGTSDDDRRNAIVVDKDGKVSFPQENVSVTDLANQAKKIPNDISRTATDATFVYSKDGHLTPLFYLRQATASLAGLMSAADKTKLDNLSQEIESLKQRIAALEGNA